MRYLNESAAGGSGIKPACEIEAAVQGGKDGAETLEGTELATDGEIAYYDLAGSVAVDVSARGGDGGRIEVEQLATRVAARFAILTRIGEVEGWGTFEFLAEGGGNAIEGETREVGAESGAGT